MNRLLIALLLFQLPILDTPVKVPVSVKDRAETKPEYVTSKKASTKDKPEYVTADTGSGEQAKAIITTVDGSIPSEIVDSGEVLFLSAKQSVRGTSTASIVWIVEPQSRAERSRTVESNQILIVPTGSSDTVIYVTQAVALADTVSIQRLKFTVRGVNPPAPIPSPTPIPTPVPVPSELSALFTKYPPPSSPERNKVAQAFWDIADLIDQDQITNVSALMMKTGEGLFGATTPATLVGWIPWRDALSDYLEKNQPANFKDHAKMWREIAKLLNPSITRSEAIMNGDSIIPLGTTLK